MWVVCGIVIGAFLIGQTGKEGCLLESIDEEVYCFVVYGFVVCGSLFW